VRVIGAAEVEAALDYAPLADALGRMFADGCALPMRHHHPIPTPGGAAGLLLLMPAWQDGRHIGIKVVTVFPDNPARSLPSVMGVYLLLDAMTGTPVALLDGPALTLRRTAAASALAARYLARQDAARLLMVGTGALAPHLVRAHGAVRPIREVRIWGRDKEKARALARRLSGEGIPTEATDDLEAAVRRADVISCATMAIEPLVRGAWLEPGVHLDLVGGFTPAMREADDEAVARARVFVDTRAGALAEAGDIVQPLRSGAIAPPDVLADLFELTRGQHVGRLTSTEITLFKSVGTALEDLAAARLAIQQGPGSP
jgi:ornithine cyclodeaminase